MRRFFPLLVLLVLAALALSTAKADPIPITCTIENPCGWMNEGDLDFCLDSLKGDDSELTLTIRYPATSKTESIALKASRPSSTQLYAISEDGKFDLKTSSYDEGYLGGIVVEPEKVGFFVYCESATSGR